MQDVFFMPKSSRFFSLLQFLFSFIHRFIPPVYRKIVFLACISIYFCFVKPIKTIKHETFDIL